MTMSWTDERVERLKKLWADGLSASQIAAELGGVSRNAVIGKVHRLNLPGRAKSGGSSASRAKRVSSASRGGYASRSGATRSIPRTRGATALKPDIIAAAVYCGERSSRDVKPCRRRYSYSNNAVETETL